MNYLKETAEALGLSKTSVYKAISHSKNISYKTKRRVLEYISDHYPEKIGGTDRPAAEKKKNGINISVVMPYKPNYFWDIAIRGIEEAAERAADVPINLKYSFYSGMIDEKEILSVLDSVNTDTIDALAVVPVNTQAVAEKLANIASVIPVAAFNEFCDGCGAMITVVSDGYAEGKRIAEMTAECTREGEKVLILEETESYPSGIIKERKRGFTETLTALTREKSVRISRGLVKYPDSSEQTHDTNYIYNSLMPSLMARLISKECKDNSELAAIYAPNGTLYPISVALNKLRRRDVFIFGNEVSKSALDQFMNGVKGGYVKMDIRKQGYIALDALVNMVLNGKRKYPETFITDFESHFYN